MAAINTSGQKQATGSGTSANAYASAAHCRCRYLDKKTLCLKNTDGSNGLSYKLLGYLSEGGTATELVAETALAAGEDALFNYNNAYHALDLQLKSTVADTHATYTVEFTATADN